MAITDHECIPVAMDVKPRAAPDGLAPSVPNRGAVATIERMLIRLESSDVVPGSG